MKQKLLSTTIICFIFLTFSKCKKPDPNADLSTSKWQVESIKKPGSFFLKSAKSNYTLMFQKDKTYNLMLDVNACSGQYETFYSGKIKLEAQGCTKKCCDSEFAEELLKIISSVTDYSVKDDILSLSGEGEVKLKRQ